MGKKDAKRTGVEAEEFKAGTAVHSLRQLAVAARAVAAVVALVATWTLLAHSTMDRPVYLPEAVTFDRDGAVESCSADVTRIELFTEWMTEPGIKSFENIKGDEPLRNSDGQTVCQQIEYGLHPIKLELPASLPFRLANLAVWLVWCGWVAAVATVLLRFLGSLDVRDPFTGGVAKSRVLQRAANLMTMGLALWVVNFFAFTQGLPIPSLWVAGIGLVGGYLLSLLAVMVRRGGELRDEAEATI
jgi:hypothetical protein